MATKKPRTAELEVAPSNQEVTSEPEAETVSETVSEDEVENFKLYLGKMTAELLKSYKVAIDAEIAKRRRVDLDKVAEFFKTLPLEEQQIFLESIKNTTASKQQLAGLDSEEKPSKEKVKDPLRMYQNFPSDEDTQFKVAPLVNMELKEIFTGGNPKNKVWLANLPLEERYEQFGTMKKLEADSNFIYDLMKVPKAVFKCEEGNWVDCCLN
jgi:hypothetical protein